MSHPKVNHLPLQLAVGSLLIGLGQGAQFALLPLVVDLTGLSPATVGGIVGGSTLIGILGALSWGRIADRHGAKTAALCAIGIYALAQAVLLAVLYAATQNFLAGAMLAAAVVAARLLHGFSVAGVQPVLQGWCSAVTDAAGRLTAFARLSAALNLGRLIGPLIAAAAVIAPLLPFALIALLALPALAVVARLPIPPRGPAAQQDAPPAPRGIDASLVSGFLLTLALGQLYATLGLFLQVRNGLDAEGAAAALGWNLSLAALAGLAVQLLLVPRLKSAGEPRHPKATAAAILAVALGALTPLALDTPIGGALAASLLSAGATLLAALITTRVSLRAGAGRHGRAAGRQSAAQTLGYAAGATLGGALFQLDPAAPFYASAAAALLVALPEGATLRTR